jgi:hypothetical protein
MAEKFLINQAGQLREREALVASTGEDDAGKIVGLDAGGKLDESLMPTGIGADIKLLPASEALNGGDFVNIWNDAGTLRVRKADATAPGGKDAHGFVLEAVAGAATAAVYTDGINDQLTGLTGGPGMFLATTPGQVTATAPSATGAVVQRVGVRLSATEVAFQPGDSIVLA